MYHAGIMIRDLDRALAFYSEKLGFPEFWRGGPATVPEAAGFLAGGLEHALGPRRDAERGGLAGVAFADDLRDPAVHLVCIHAKPPQRLWRGFATSAMGQYEGEHARRGFH